jgi:hypothetical protein
MNTTSNHKNEIRAAQQQQSFIAVRSNIGHDSIRDQVEPQIHYVHNLRLNCSLSILKSSHSNIDSILHQTAKPPHDFFPSLECFDSGLLYAACSFFLNNSSSFMAASANTLIPSASL